MQEEAKPLSLLNLFKWIYDFCKTLNTRRRMIVIFSYKNLHPLDYLSFSHTTTIIRNNQPYDGQGDQNPT